MTLFTGLILAPLAVLIQPPPQAEVVKAKAVVDERPDDQKARTVLALHAAFWRDWGAAVEHMESLKNVTIEKLLAEDLEVSTVDLVALVKAGDRWMSSASKLGSLKPAAVARALHYYELAWPMAEPSEKAKLRVKARNLLGAQPRVFPIRKGLGRPEHWNSPVESSSSYWTTEFPFEGRRSAKLLSTGREDAKGYAHVLSERIVPPVAGTELTVAAWVYTDETEADGQLMLRMFQFDGALADQRGPVIEPDTPFWRKLEFKVKVHPKAERMDVIILHRSTVGVTYVDAVSIKDDAGREYVKNGSLER